MYPKPRGPPRTYEGNTPNDITHHILKYMPVIARTRCAADAGSTRGGGYSVLPYMYCTY
jgi:hypothetical protein